MLYIAGMIAFLFVLIIALTWFFVCLHHAIEHRDNDTFSLWYGMIFMGIIFLGLGVLILANMVRTT